GSETSECFPPCPQSGRIVHPRTSASLQRCCRVALGFACALDIALAVEPHEFVLGGLAGTPCREQFIYGFAQLADVLLRPGQIAPWPVEITLELVALGRQGGELFAGVLPGADDVDADERSTPHGSCASSAAARRPRLRFLCLWAHFPFSARAG